MDNYNEIYTELLQLIERGKRKFIIYPTGRNGALAEIILKERFGIYDAIKADNLLSEVNEEIYKPNELQALAEEYTWLITSEQYSLTKELLDIIKPLNINSDRICVIFHKRYHQYGQEYKLLSYIGKVPNSQPAYEFIEIIKKKKFERRNISVAEIGIDVGATAVEACKLLEAEDCYYIFDFQDLTGLLKEDLHNVPDICCEIKACGNSRKTYDSYCYTLCDLLFDMRNKGLNGIFDVVYLDGLHGFNTDGLAICLLKELMKPEGYLVVDDLNWTWEQYLKTSPESDNIAEWASECWTDHQLSEAQVRRAVNAFMVHDKSYEEVIIDRFNSARIIYKKRQ